MNIDPNDFKELVKSVLTFVSTNSGKVGISEIVKRLAAKKLDKKEALVTRKDIINATNSICFVLCMCSHGYVSSLLFTEMNSQNFTKVITVSMFALGVVIVAPKRIIDKSQNNT